MSPKEQWFLPLCSRWNDCKFHLSTLKTLFVNVCSSESFKHSLCSALGNYPPNSLPRPVWWDWFFTWWTSGTCPLALLCVCSLLFNLCYIFCDNFDCDDNRNYLISFFGKIPGTKEAPVPFLLVITITVFSTPSI